VLPRFVIPVGFASDYHAQYRRGLKSVQLSYSIHSTGQSLCRSKRTGEREDVSFDKVPGDSKITWLLKAVNVFVIAESMCVHPRRCHYKRADVTAANICSSMIADRSRFSGGLADCIQPPKKTLNFCIARLHSGKRVSDELYGASIRTCELSTRPSIDLVTN
jgi:hypothetical protein